MDKAPSDEGIKLVAQKEEDIRQLTGQLDRAMAIKEQENTETIRMHKLIAIVQLQDDLELKNSELNKLRQEMRDLYTAIASGGKGEEYYAMPNTPHGICLIINNYMFHQVDPRYEALSDRGGATVDQRNLLLTFEFLQYKVEVHENCTLTALVKGTFCHTLINKPKLFFVQADRGEVEDSGIEVLSDGNGRLPVEADFFFGYTTPLRYVAYRSRRFDSWYIS